MLDSMASSEDDDEDNPPKLSKRELKRVESKKEARKSDKKGKDDKDKKGKGKPGKKSFLGKSNRSARLEKRSCPASPSTNQQFLLNRQETLARRARQIVAPRVLGRQNWR